MRMMYNAFQSRNGKNIEFYQVVLISNKSVHSAVRIRNRFTTFKHLNRQINQNPQPVSNNRSKFDSIGINMFTF